jgi:HSP20 family protein
MTTGKRRTGDDEARTRGGGLLGGLIDLVEKLNELAETGRELSGQREFTSTIEGEKLKGVVGFNVKMGLGDESVSVEPFGNIKRDRDSGKTVVQEIREPLVDVIEEDDHALVLAEMPGITAEDVRIEVQDDVLTINAERGDKKYRKEILLPESYPREKMVVSCNNGILEIKCFS